VGADTLLGEVDAGHLLRRTGFGALPKEVKKFAAFTRGKAVERILGYKPKSFAIDPAWRYFELGPRWFEFMLRNPKLGLQEKLVLFWHDHFATSADKVTFDAMNDQNVLLRTQAKGNFKDFVKAINVDRAMAYYLDSYLNQKTQPNENYARELMELFTLGVLDFGGHANYAQQDIVQIARAFSGWRGSVFIAGDHDYTSEFPERGPKTIFATPVDLPVPPGGFGAAGRPFDDLGEGAKEQSRVIDILFDHTDSDGKNTVARRITQRLIEYFAHANPDVAFIDRVVDASGFAVPGPTQWSIDALLRALFVDDEFYPSTYPALHGGAPKPKSVKWPIDLVVSTMRILRMKPWDKELVRLGNAGPVYNLLSDMGQILQLPPSVFGWNWEAGWIGTSTLLARYKFVIGLVEQRFLGPNSSRFRWTKLMKPSLTRCGDVIDAIATALGIHADLSASERAALAVFLNGSADEDAAIDLKTWEAAGLVVPEAFILLMQSPAFQVH
jgi:uncharacterized protein (DUF1800 family)